MKLAFKSFATYAVAPLADGGMEGFREAVDLHRFRALLPHAESGAGWTAVDDPGTPPLEGDTFGAASLVFLGIRRDQKSVPAALLRVRAQEAERLWAGVNGRPPPPNVKSELAKTTKLEILATMPATPSTGVVLYDVAEGRLVVGTAEGKIREAVLALWKATTGHAPVATGPLDRVARELDEPTLEFLSPDSRAAHRRVHAEQLGRFLAWLWWRGEASADGLATVQTGEGGSVGWVATGGVGIRDQDTRKRRLTVKAEDAASDPALRVALVEGHDVDGLELSVHRDGGWMLDITLAIKEEELAVTGLKLPPVHGDVIEQLCAIDFHAQQADWALGEMFLAWARVAGHPERQPQSLSSLRHWLEGEVLEWAARKTRFGERLLDAASGSTP